MELTMLGVWPCLDWPKNRADLLGRTEDEVFYLFVCLGRWLGAETETETTTMRDRSFCAWRTDDQDAYPRGVYRQFSPAHDSSMSTPR